MRVNPLEQFVAQFGKSARFVHIGLDSEQIGRKTLYHRQPYAVFEVPGGTRAAFTIGDLSGLMRAAAQRNGQDAAKTRMNTQLALAEADYGRYQDIIRELTGAPPLTLVAAR